MKSGLLRCCRGVAAGAALVGLMAWAGLVEAAPRGRAVEVEATAYSAQDPGLSNWTAIGTRLRRGVIAVDPDFIPLGSRVYIPDYGEAVAEDVGGAIVGNVIDVAFDTHAEALDFGRQYLVIYLLDEEAEEETAEAAGERDEEAENEVAGEADEEAEAEQTGAVADEDDDETEDAAEEEEADDEAGEEQAEDE